MHTSFKEQMFYVETSTCSDLLGSVLPPDLQVEITPALQKGLFRFFLMWYFI